MILVEAIQWFALIWVVLSLFQHAAQIVSIKYKSWNKVAEICKKCWTFWLVLALTWNPFIAAIAAFCAMLESNYNTVKL
jgi:hypothetical protein